ncbi:MAG: hypothetical protein IBJ17_17425 [Reyranella sp.]|nr:hypothetical protein [Reyranella sp.]
MGFQFDIFLPDRIVTVVARGDITMFDLAKLTKDLIDAQVLTYRKIIDITSATSAIAEN